MFDAAAIRALPDVLVGPNGFPTDRRPRLVSTGWGGSVRSSFSGSSAYLAEAGMAHGSLDGAFTLLSDRRPERTVQLRGAAWKLRQALRRESTSGFKFSGQFSAALWNRYARDLAGVDVINNFQLFSDEFFARRADLDVRGFFYLDGTLHDYLRGYRDYDVARIGPATVDRAVEVERRGYHAADGVAVMSDFVARSLVEHYGLPRERVTVVLPGANLSDEMATRVLELRAERGPAEELTVGFVGLYPERKGLPKLAEAVTRLRADGVAVRLLVVGRCPPPIAELDGVEALGVISKSGEPERFARALARMDLGAQLSTVELSGIATLEFLRCGIPLLSTEVGGLPETMRGGGALGVPGDVSAEQVAEEVRRLVEDRTRYEALAAEAAGRMDGVRWVHTADELGRFVEAVRR